MKKYAMETTVGIFLVFGLLCLGYMTVKLGHVSLLGRRFLSAVRPVHLGDRPAAPAARCTCWVSGSAGLSASPWTRRISGPWWR